MSRPTRSPWRPRHDGIALATAALLASAAAAAAEAPALLDEDPSCAASPDGDIKPLPSRVALSGHQSASTEVDLKIPTSGINGLRIAGGRLFYGSGGLQVRDGVDGTQRQLISFWKARGPNGAPIGLDFFAPSNDGSKVAYGTRGAGEGEVRVVDVATGRQAIEVVGHADRGAISWLPDTSGFLYSRWSAASPDANSIGAPGHRILVHVLGTGPERDVEIVGAGVPGSPPMAAADVPMLFTTPGSDFAVLAIFHATEAWPTLFVAPLRTLRQPKTPWHTVASPADHVTDFALHGRRLFLLSHGDEPASRVLEVDARAPRLARAKTVVPAGPRVIRCLLAADDAVYTLEHCVTKGRIRRLGLADGSLRDVELPMRGYIEVATSDPAAPGMLFMEDSWKQLAQFFRTEGGAPVRITGLGAPPTPPPPAPPPASKRQPNTTWHFPRRRWP